MTEPDIFDRLDDLGCYSLQFIKGHDGRWSAHVRVPGAPPPHYLVCYAPSLRDALLGAIDGPDQEALDLL